MSRRQTSLEVRAQSGVEAEPGLFWSALVALGPHLAHEVRSPLNTLVIELELLSRIKARDEENAAALARRRNTLQRELARLQESVDRLLSLLVPKPEDDPWEVQPLLEEVTALVAAMARHRGLGVSAGGGCKLDSSADRRAARAALLELAIAAVEQNAGRGGRVQLGCCEEAGVLRCSVEWRSVEGATDAAGEPDSPALRLSEATQSRLAVSGATVELEPPSRWVLTFPASSRPTGRA